MIPTGHRTKIPKILSYPLGAKAISEALEGVPQTGSLTVDFFFYNSEWRNRPDPALRYRVLSVSYWHVDQLMRKFSYADGHFDASWRITVEPVPRNLRQTVQLKLLQDAMPIVRRWLIASHDTGDRAGGHNLFFYYEELANELKVEENSSIDWKTARST
jgi:hypothetical protein